MDNNSKNTLFGFEAISDMLTEGYTSSELSDEELETLKTQSAKVRPATPGAIDDKQSEEEEEEIDEEELEVEESTKKAKKSKKEEAAEQEEDDSEESEEEVEESSKVGALFDAIADELGWEFDEEEEKKPSNVEELVEYFKDVIKENSVPEYASEDIKALDEYVRNGGKLETYLSATPDIDLDTFDTTIESNQKQVVRMLLTEKGFNEKQISRKLEKYEEAGILEDEAEDAVESLKEIAEVKKEQLLTKQKKEHQEAIERQQSFMDGVVNEISAMDNVRGIKVPEKDKKALLAYIFKADATGKTQYQKDYSKSVKNLIESAYFTMKGDTLLDTAKKMGTSSAIKNLKQSLRSTGIGKGTKRVNTTPSNSIFSRAVQLL